MTDPRRAPAFLKEKPDVRPPFLAVDGALSVAEWDSLIDVGVEARVEELESRGSARSMVSKL